MTRLHHQGFVLLEPLVWLHICIVIFPIIISMWLCLTTFFNKSMLSFLSVSEKDLIFTIFQQDILGATLHNNSDAVVLTTPSDTIYYYCINNRLKRKANYSQFLTDFLSINSLTISSLNSSCVTVNTTLFDSLSICTPGVN